MNRTRQPDAPRRCSFLTIEVQSVRWALASESIDRVVDESAWDGVTPLYLDDLLRPEIPVPREDAKALRRVLIARGPTGLLPLSTTSSISLIEAGHTQVGSVPDLVKGAAVGSLVSGAIIVDERICCLVLDLLPLAELDSKHSHLNVWEGAL